MKILGEITSYSFHNIQLIKDQKGPKPNFCRAPTDNDLGNGMERKNIEWKNASLNLKVEKIVVLNIKTIILKFPNLYPSMSKNNF